MTEQRPWTWPWLIATSLAKAVLAVLICLGLWGAVPAAFGWQPTTVSSGSMLPRLHIGDVAVARPIGPAPPTLGSVLLFDDPDHPGRLRLHRFVRIDDDGQLITRGDANADDDSSPIALTAVRGVGTLRVPWVGLPVVWVRERTWLPLGIGLVLLVALTAVAAQGRSFGFPESSADTDDDDTNPGGPADADEDHPVASTRLGTAVTPRSPFTSRAAGAVLGAVLLSLVPAAPAGAVFTDTTATQNAAAATPYFSCANAVAAAGPYFWYRLDETSSTAITAADSSGGARNGTYGQSGKTAGATRACSRDSGRAMTFNGSSGYLTSPFINSAAPNTFTFSVWFKTTTGRGGKLMGFGNAQTGASSSYDRHIYLTNAGRVVFGVYPNTAKTITSPKAYNDGGWHQTVASLSPAGMQLYVDGDRVASDASVTTGENSTAGYLRIAYDNLDGWDSAPTSRFFAGTLDDVAVYPTALSASQVDALYEAGT